MHRAPMTLNRATIAMVVGILMHAAPRAIAQVPADSARPGSRLAVHLPLLPMIPSVIPFFHHRHRSERTRSAQPDSNRVIDVEVGYDDYTRAGDVASDRSASVTLVVTPAARLEIEGDIDVRDWELPAGGSEATGRGDTRATIQWTVFTRGGGNTAVAIAYAAKLPTAADTVIGSGRIDHRLQIPASFSFGGVELDLITGADADGTPSGFQWGIEAAASVAVRLMRRVTVHGGISTQGIGTDLPRGTYVNAGISWELGRLLEFDTGGRAGFGAQAPRYGITAGFTSALVTRNLRQ